IIHLIIIFRFILILQHIIFIIFFFQAEDGIRDFHVTGVQTCALPISTYNMIYLDGKTGIAYAKRYNVTSITRDKEYDLTRGTPRSEERRVGKECRTQWLSYN